MRMYRPELMLGGILLLCSAGLAYAQEVTTYTYDSKGRVVTTSRSGGPSSGVGTTYTYDRANNRSNVTVSGSPNGSGRGSDGASTDTTLFVVVPLNGYTVIPIN